MTTLPGHALLRLIIILIIGTLLISCGSGDTSQNANSAGITYRLKWPVAKSVGGLVPAGVDTIRMSVSGPGMSTMTKDFAAAAGTGTIEGVPAGINRTITFQGLSGTAIIYQKNLTGVPLVKNVTYDCGTVALETVSNNLSTPVVPAAPSGLSATAVSASQINLAWVDNSNNETGFRIERKSGANGTYEPLPKGAAANDNSFNDIALSASTVYYYRVRAFNTVGDSENFSNEAEATTLVDVPTPTYSISGTITSGGVPLTGVAVTRSGNSSGTASTSTDDYGSYSFSGLKAGSYKLTPRKLNYTFYPADLTATVDSANVAALNFTATAVNTAPAAPTSLNATLAASSTMISLAWKDNANNETGYIIERMIGTSGTFTRLATVAANVTACNDSSLSPDTTYTYRVWATNDFGTSAYGETSATTPVKTYIISGTIKSEGLALPNVSVALTGSGSTMAATNSAGYYSFNLALAGGYTLKPSRDGYVFSPETLSVTVSSSDLTLNNFEATAIPVVPTGLKATAVSSNLINLAWTGTNNKSSYEIERTDVANGNITTIPVAAGVTSYRDTTVSTSTTYAYRIRAIISAAAISNYSEEVRVSTPVAGTAISPVLVNMGSFSIGKYEVTQREWLAVMGNNPSFFTACGLDCPVENVSWNDVQDFIDTLNSRSGKNYRLPTSTEWKYAAQNGWNGGVYTDTATINTIAWHSGNSLGTTHQVGLKKHNDFGIYDMIGNVYEWMNGSGATRYVQGGAYNTSITTTYTEDLDISGSTVTTKGKMLGFRLAQ